MKEFDGKPYCEFWGCVLTSEEAEFCKRIKYAKCLGKAEFCRDREVTV